METALEAIEKLLWEEWDPIGARAFGCPPDEYDSYADEVCEMLSKGADADAIAHYLTFVATVLIGNDPDDELNIKIARKAVAIHSSRAGN